MSSILTHADAFLWGVVIGGAVMHVLNRSYERIMQRRIAVADERIAQLQRQIEAERTGHRELHASRIELALNFAAMRRAARDEVHS